jgi:Protein of unknown function (DUF2914)/Tetratricopeptide repeat
MPDVRDVGSLLDAAEQAAGAGNYASAREYLRQAIGLQEASLGPTHPVLANFLNNLGVIYEREGNPAEAEGCYRRAYAVASAALAPDHPFVVMSASNLREFCDARGLPFDTSTGSAAALSAPHADRVPEESVPLTATLAGPAPLDRTPADGPPELPTQAADEAARAEHKTATDPQSPSMERLVWAGLIIGALLAVGVIVMQSRSATRSQPTARMTSARADRPKPAAKARNVPFRGEATRRHLPGTDRDAPAKVAAFAPTLAAAELCRTLQTGNNWRCAPATGTLRPGVVFFYTRLLSQIETTVQHRWYRGSRLHQSVTLRVHANSRAGYRTYSQMTVSPARAGDWRVELRAANGAVLHEERFTVGQ